MKEAAASQKRTPQKQKSNEFEETFKPQKSNVKFGVGKNEKTNTSKIKKGKSPKKLVVILLAVIVLLGGSCAALYFTGLLTPVLELVGLAEPAAGSEATLEEREALVALRQTQLDAKEKDLTKREEQLAQQQAEQIASETEDNPNGSSQGFGELLKNLSDEKLEEIKRVGLIYSKMDPGEGAGIMESMYEAMDISYIIYYMQPAAAALLLGQMDTELAANVTKMMLN